MRALALFLLAALPARAQTGRAAAEARAVAPVPAVGQSAAGAPLSAPALVLPQALAAPSLPTPALPTAAARAAVLEPAVAAKAALAAPAAAATPVQPALLGPDGKPIKAAQGAESAGRAAPEAPELGALFDGAGLDLSRDGSAFSGPAVAAAPTPAGVREAARTRLKRAAASAQKVAAEAAAARTFQGRAMSLDDPCCGVAAPVMGVLMRRAGVPVDAVQAEFHTFLAYREGAEVYVVDPTVRQFFGGARAPASVPQVFVGTLGELDALFAAHAAAKTTRYGTDRIYRSEAVVKNALLGEAAGLARWAVGRQGLLSPAEAVERDTYRGLGAALAAPPPAVNAAKAPEPGRSWWSSVKEFISPTPKPDAAWEAVAASIGPELETLRAMTKEARAGYLRRAGADIVERLKARHGTAEIGFHYNLHGGRPEQYTEAGGIRATMGDIALQYSMHGDRSYKVYFFRSSQHSLYDLLSERHPNLVSPRMGDVLMLFKVDGFIKRALETGVARNLGAISVDFDETKLPRMIGVPKEDFLGAPLTVFSGVGRRLGRKLSRDEETLAVMRYIEAALGADPVREGGTARVGRARLDLSKPMAKALLETVGDPHGRPVLGLIGLEDGAVHNFALMDPAMAAGHRDLLPVGADPKGYRGFSAFLSADGELTVLGSGGFPGPVTPAMVKAVRAAAGLP